MWVYVSSRSNVGFFAHLQHAALLLAHLLDKRRVWFISCFSVFYMGVTSFQASRILLELDELCTFHISRVNTIHDIWLALLSGADTNPPFQIYSCPGLHRSIR